jgi:bifunctional non-homologous end joining protein LigD
MAKPEPDLLEQFEGVLKFSNLDKVLYPATGFTKGDLIRYFVAISPYVIPHLEGRALTLRRYPNGVDQSSFFEKRCPKHAPEFVKVVTWKPSSKEDPIQAPMVDNVDTMAWLGNMAAIELHPSLAKAAAEDRPTVLVFDLDPGAPAGLQECSVVALWLREKLEGMELRSFPKTSGSKGMQIYVPFNTPLDFETTKTLSHGLAIMLETEHPDLVISKMATQLRKGKIFIDWNQNDRSKTTVSVYSTRARDAPTVSTPLHWEEVERVAHGEDPMRIVFDTTAVLDRVAQEGDLFGPVQTLEQKLPAAVERAVADLVARGQ